MPALLLLLLSLLCGAPARANSPAAAPSTTTVLVVVGAPGEDEFEPVFAKSAELWNDACQTAGANLLVIGQAGATPQTNDFNLIREFLEKEPKAGPGELWIVLLGHGTFDGKEAKFNLRGPDLSATDLASWLEPFQRPVAVINTTSSSSPFLNKLSKAGRVIITATRSGNEQNYTRFGKFFCEAITNLKADLDKDGQVSLLEAFLQTAHAVAEYYQTEGRLATEHPLLDDNGDGLGTPADWFRGVRAVKRAADGAALDGLRAHQFHLIRSEQEKQLAPEVRARRNELELAIEELRSSKEKLNTDEYYQRLEPLLLELARLYETNSAAAPPTQ